jgi:hypothetical protein
MIFENRKSRGRNHFFDIWELPIKGIHIPESYPPVPISKKREPLKACILCMYVFYTYC